MDAFRWQIARECLEKFFRELDAHQLYEAGLIWEQVVQERESAEAKQDAIAFVRMMNRAMKGGRNE